MIQRKRKPQFKFLSTQLTPSIAKRIYNKKATIKVRIDEKFKPHRLISVEQK